ncbi:hypothetical protein Tco_0793213 [Tanacetum coccineum]
MWIFARNLIFNVTTVASRGWSFASAVPGQMTHLVAISTLDSANLCDAGCILYTKGGFHVVVIAIVGVVILILLIGIAYVSSFCSLKKSVVNITNTSTNKAFQVPVDPSRLQSPLNSIHKLFAPCHILLSPESRIHTRIDPFNLEFLNSVIQCFQNACQRTITELVYFVESHDLSVGGS